MFVLRYSGVKYPEIKIPGKLPGISDPEDREQPQTVMKSAIIGLQEITAEHTAVNRAEIIHKTLSRMEIVDEAR